MFVCGSVSVTVDLVDDLCVSISGTTCMVLSYNSKWLSLKQ